MPRQFHRKSRFGCMACKKRRVKCDEEEPVCGGCVRTRSECQYPCLNSNPKSSPPNSTTTRLSSPSVVESANGSQFCFDLLDMTLMHHYARTTGETLFIGVRQCQVWQHDIPVLAGSNVILMHGLLAVSALHCAWKDPVQRKLYRSRAMHHHTLGLSMFQEMVSAASSKTAEVIVAFSILLSIWIYAFPEIASEQSSLDDIFSSLEIVRGAFTVSKLYRQVIIGGCMKVFVDPPSLPSIPQIQVYSLQQILQLLNDQVEHPADKAAAQGLQTLLGRFITGLDNNRLAAMWMASVADDYWTRLRSHDPHALLVFSYSTLLVRASEHRCWWMAGWSRRILQACSDTMSSDVKESVHWDYHEHQIREGADQLESIVQMREDRQD